MGYPAWLENAIFYQIYPQSFQDSNNDGIGDIPGIISRLDYLESLGVNALWLNPCFVSPFQDAGYDVSDYYRVAPRYGSNADLIHLFQEAHRRGMHVLLDLVPGHTSTQHPWFQQSCQHQPNPYSDWYIWTDSAWKWQVPGFRAVSGYGERDGSYITNFFFFQPALNYGFANPDPEHPWQQPVNAPGPQRVRQELKNIMRFWLEKGADGFRVDMAFSLVKNDPGQAATCQLWREMRAFLDQEFPEAIIISEWSNPSLAINAGFHMDFLLPFGTPGWTALLRKPYGPGPAHDPYAFSFFDRSGHGNIREFLDDYLKHYQATRSTGLIAFPTGNHDVNPRLSIGRDEQDLKLIFLMLLTMPGVPFIYYGDEIGMRTISGLPSKEGAYDRTGIRTPMQWDASSNAGFSNAMAEVLYLPVDPAPDRPSVAQAEANPDSLISHIRTLAAIRKNHPALQSGAEFTVVVAEAGKCPIVFLRSRGNEHALVGINPSNQPGAVDLPDLGPINPKLLYGQADIISRSNNIWQLALPPVSGALLLI